MAGNEVRFDIVATDKASKQLDQVADKAEQVEKLDPKVDVTANTSKADHSLDGMADQLDKLTDADKVVVLALRAGSAQSELTELATKLATIDKSDPDLAVTFDRYNEVSGQLEDLETKIKQIGDTDVDVKPGGGGNLEEAQKRLKNLGDEADKTQGAVHSMAGNALGDMAATTSGIGPLGEAIGQLTETALAGETGLKGLATAGLGLGAIAGGIAVLNAVMGHFADQKKRAAEIDAFNLKGVQDYTKSITAAATELAKLNGTKIGDPLPTGVNERMLDLSSKTQALIAQWKSAGKIEAFDPVTNQITDMTAMLAKSNITAEEWAAAVIDGGVAINKLGTEARNSGVSVDTQTEIMQTAAAESVKYNTAQTDAADRTKVFGDEANKTAGQVGDLKTMTQEMRNQQMLANRQTDAAAGFLKTAADRTKELEDAYRDLSDQVSNDQAMIDLKNQIDDVTVAGTDAMNAQKAADDARASGAKDAAEKQAMAEFAMRSYQTAVNQTKDDIIHIAEVAKVSPIELKATLDKLDQGDLNGAKADAEAWSRRNPISLTTQLVLSMLPSSLRSLLGVGGTSASGTSAAPTSTTVNNFLAAPVAARELARTQGRRARINGR